MRILQIIPAPTGWWMEDRFSDADPERNVAAREHRDARVVCFALVDDGHGEVYVESLLASENTDLLFRAGEAQDDGRLVFRSERDELDIAEHLLRAAYEQAHPEDVPVEVLNFLNRRAPR